MKSIANQYRDLQEGKMSQANFMRNLRMNMPQVTNTTSFGDAVKILKNKGIITESFNPAQDAENAKYKSPMDRMYNSDDYVKAQKDEKGSDDDDEFDAILKQLEDEMGGEDAVKGQYDEELNEAKETTNPNSIHPKEYTMGIRYELKCFKGDVVKAERAVLKNLAKEPFYYTALKLAGKDIYKESPSVKAEAPKKKSKKKEVELVDTVNAMQKVKMPKADEKKKIKENVDEKMRFQDLPAGEEYKTVKDSKGKIIKATNKEGIEFQRGDEATAVDNGEMIYIVDFKEEQGIIKALYNTGMFFKTISIDGLEAPKETVKPGVDMGKSFEKFKSKLSEMVKKAMAEFYDGRDNLTDISDDTKD
jgi:hypothetical protein